MDITIISPLHGNGRAMPNSRRIDGAACIRADVRNREDDYPDVHQADSAQLLCLASETYGRWGDHCITLVRHLARFKVKNCPDLKRRIGSSSQADSALPNCFGS